ncbi:MAG: RNA polymerase sigma factor [Lachnospiraceae bacterium]|nr:RNA polymerase sigma factor [Lachnospiraceae bacterium]
MDGSSLDKKTDELLYKKYLKDADHSAFEVLLRRYREPLTLFLYGILNNIEDAEDIMLDAYAVAAMGKSSFAGKSSFKTWLYAIGRNLALKSVRKKHFFFMPINEEVTEIPGDNGIPDMELLQSEDKQILYKALEKINPDYRQILHLIYFENMSNDEAAKVLKKNKKQVYNLVARGKQSLKETLEALGYER